MASPAPEEPFLPPGHKSKRPAKSRFRQQQLPAWRPILTPVSVLPIFVSVGIAFIIAGAVMLVENEEVTEEEFDYTHCNRRKSSLEPPGTPDQSCYDLLKSNNSYTDVNTLGYRCECHITVTLRGFKDKTTHVYYALENFYQNHRRYVKSRSDRQLRAAQANGGETCEPILHNGNLSYAPCGLIANSIFNDTVSVQRAGLPATSVDLTGSGIAWQSDLDDRFKNPDYTGSDPCTAEWFNPTRSIKPPNWPVPACQLGATRNGSAVMCDFNSAFNGNVDTCVYNPWYANKPEFASSGLGYENEDLVVWMRVAALPNFRKPWRIAHGGMEDGSYTINIGYNFPVDSFDGKKKIIFTTTNAVGGDNPFVGGCYVTVGILSLIGGIGFFFFAKWELSDRKLGDVSKLSWEHE